MSKFKPSRHEILLPNVILSSKDKDRKLTRLLDEVNRAYSELQSTLNRIRTANVQTEENTKLIAELKQLKHTATEDSLAYHFIQDNIDEKLRTSTRITSNNKYQLVRAQEEHKTWGTKTREYVKYLQQKTFKDICIRDVVTQVANHPQVIARPPSKSPKIFCQPLQITRKYLVCQLTGLKMTPRFNRYKFICGGELPAPIPLGKIKVIIDLTTNSVRLEPIGNDPVHYRRNGWGRSPTVHPHVLTHYSPCLGDFGPPLNEALDSYDFASALDIICMFLESADPNDPAGATWVNWVIPLTTATYEIRGSDPDNPYSRNGYRYVQDENGHFYAISKAEDAEAQIAERSAITTIKRADVDAMINDHAVPLTPTATQQETENEYIDLESEGPQW